MVRVVQLAGDAGQPVDLAVDEVLPGMAAGTHIQIARDAEKQRQHHNRIRQRIPNKNGGFSSLLHGLISLLACDRILAGRFPYIPRFPLPEAFAGRKRFLLP